MFPSTLMACQCLTHIRNANYGNHFFSSAALAVFHIESYDALTPKEVSLIIIIDLLKFFGPTEKKTEHGVRCLLDLYLFAKEPNGEIDDVYSN